MTTFHHDGVELFYEVLGEGEPVAFLNGVLMTAQSWVLQTSVLRRRYRCILHDFRGQLRSPLDDAPCSFPLQVEDLAALLDHLELDSCHLVGTSYGGEVGMLFAATYPERVRSLSVIASVSRPGPLLIGQCDRWAEIALADRSAVYRFMTPTVFSDRFLTANPDLVRQGEERLSEAPGTFFQDLVQLVRAFRKLDLDDDLADIDCPTLVIGAEEDILKPVRYSREIARRIPHSELLIVPDAGHAVVLERPEVINTALIGFIEKHRSHDPAGRAPVQPPTR